MDLGITGRRAIVCASSRGLGRACAFSLAREGVAVTLNGRDETKLGQTEAELKQLGCEVRSVAADITTPDGRDAVLAACPDPDILVNNAGGPPPGSFRDWSDEEWLRALQANMLTPINLIKAVIDGMVERGFGRIVNITSASVKSPIQILGLSNGARAGLTGFCAGLAREVARHNVTINNLLPGPFQTDRLRNTMQVEADRQGVAVEELAKQRAQANPTHRFGDPEEFGDACAFLCAARSGYIVGQNLLIDGGGFNSTF